MHARWLHGSWTSSCQPCQPMCVHAQEVETSRFASDSGAHGAMTDGQSAPEAAALAGALAGGGAAGARFTRSAQDRAPAAAAVGDGGRLRGVNSTAATLNLKDDAGLAACSVEGSSPSEAAEAAAEGAAAVAAAAAAASGATPANVNVTTKLNTAGMVKYPVTIEPAMINSLVMIHGRSE